MAVDQFLKIEGINGESKDGEHAEEIDVLSWSWGMSQSGSMHVGGGGGSGKVNIQDLSITKNVDSSSPNLMKACCNGQHIEGAVLTIRKAGENPVEYLIIKMKPVIITSISTGGSGGEDRLTENVTINFGSVEVSYTPQDDTGAAGGSIEMGWDIEKNIVL